MLWAAWVPGQSWLWKSLRISIVSTRVTCCNMKEEITESLAFFNDLLDLSNTNEVAKFGIWCVPALVLEFPMCRGDAQLQPLWPRRENLVCRASQFNKLENTRKAEPTAHLSKLSSPGLAGLISWRRESFRFTKRFDFPYSRWYFLCKMIRF